MTPVLTADIYIHKIGTASGGIVGRRQLVIKAYAPATGIHTIRLSNNRVMCAIGYVPKVILAVGSHQCPSRPDPEDILNHLRAPVHQCGQNNHLSYFYFHSSLPSFITTGNARSFTLPRTVNGISSIFYIFQMPEKDDLFNSGSFSRNRQNYTIPTDIYTA